MRNVDFVFFDAGGGHRAAATALKSVIEQQNRDWNVRLINLQEVLEPLDIFRKLTGIRMEDVYNRMLENGWTLGSEYLVPVMHSIIRMYHPAQVKMLAEFWSASRPDIVVSVVPNFNRAMLEGLRRAHPAVPYVTILTDFADFPPHFWIERQDQYFICGTEKALAQARAMGHGPDKTFLVSGMIVRPMFYDTQPLDIPAERTNLGLDPNRPTGVVLFGGYGSPKMVEIVERLQSIGRELQLILICGKNDKLAARLRTIASKLPLHIVGFTHEVPRYMQISDFFIGKPGPGSISEAVAMHLPVIIERNAWTLPQERYNADWVLESGVGVVVNSLKEIATAVEQMLEPAALARYKQNVRRIENRAVFEIPDILDRLMSRH
jgi:UDP-N-acetylglucosamine:LPS N-acetylglucosamine transferase